jgi:hypothetical protein
MAISKIQASGTGLTLLSSFAPTLGIEIPYVLRLIGVAIGIVMLMWPVIIWMADHIRWLGKMWLIAGVTIGGIVFLVCAVALLPLLASVKEKAAPGPLAGLSNSQLRAKTVAIAKEMREFESDFRLKVMLVDVGRPQPIEQKAMQAELNERERLRSQIRQQEVTEYRNRFHVEGTQVLDELVVRVPTKPTDDELKYKIGALRHGNLAGPAPIADAADYLERLANKLP